MTRTRSQKAVAIQNTSDNASWDEPLCKQQPSTIKTYSKKQPFRVHWSARTKKLNPLNKDNVFEDVKSFENENSSARLFSGIESGCLEHPENTPVKISKRQSSVLLNQNKTRVCAESMTACTVLAQTRQDIRDVTLEDMSLCSLVSNQDNEDLNDTTVKNSTVLNDNHHIHNKNFVPNDISAIEELAIRCYNEQTPKHQKRVRFEENVHSKNKIGGKVTKKNQKTPYYNKKYKMRKGNQKTRGATKQNENLSIFPVNVPETEISSSLVDDKEQEWKLSDIAVTEISEPHESPKDVTPETYESIKEMTCSLKRCRQLKYNIDTEDLDEAVPVCCLLDLDVTNMKTAKVWFGKWSNISVQESEDFPDDILLA